MKLLQNKRVLAGGLVGLFLGALIVLGIRFATYQPKDVVHYHANFAVYVNGEREQFKGMQYYEETAATACTLEHVDSPKERAHMHGNVNDAVHVEDHLVTWGNFMQNLGWGLGDDYLKSADSVYMPNDQNKLVFVLNGKTVETISDKIIGDRDKLLISYGSSNESQLKEQYGSIAGSAEKYDTSKDPASCGAGHEIKFSDRLKNLL